MQPAEPTLSSRHAVALGLLHGPAELLPISSSGHTTLLPWLAGSSYAELDGATRKSFEVALHAGTALALVCVLRAELREEARAMNAGRAGFLALALAPAALAGLALREPIEQRFGGVRAIAAGLLAGAAVMAYAELAPPRGGNRRGYASAGAIDGLVLGIAQASALAPGVSRSGATHAAARLRGFGALDAQRLSWSAGLPVLLGASALEACRLLRERLDPALRGPFLAGSASAFCSTLLGARLLRGRGRSLLPFAVYRCLLAALVAIRLRGGGARR